MKKTLFYSLRVCAVFVSATLLFGCKKNIATDNNSGENVGVPMSYVDCTKPYNPNNPFDSVGIYHNEILSYLDSLDLLTKENINNITAIKDAVDDWGTANFSQTNILDTSTMKSITEDVWQGDYLSYIESSNFSDTAKGMLSDLFGTMLSDSLGEIFTYCNASSIIVDFEDSVSESRLSGSEKMYLLEIASIYRYSLYYWTDYYEYLDGLNGGQMQTMGIGKWLSKHWKAIVGGTADAIGAAAGISASIIGTVTVIAGVNAAILAAGAASGAAAVIIKATTGG